MTAGSGVVSGPGAVRAAGSWRRLLRGRSGRWRRSLHGRFMVVSLVTHVARLVAAGVIMMAIGDVRAAGGSGGGIAQDPRTATALDHILAAVVLILVVHTLADVAAYRFGRDLVSRPIADILEATAPLGPGPTAAVEGPDADALAQSLARFRTAQGAAAEIARLNDELRIQVRELDAFAYSVSHDLRAPLRAIDGFAQLLADESQAGMDAQGRAYLATIRASVVGMNDLIEGLLALSRAGRDDIRLERVDPTGLARAVLEDEGIAADPDVEIRLDPLPACVADPVLLRQVLANLVQNAHKFSRGRRPARIHIGAETSSPGVGAGAVQYFVRDNGVGFDERHADRLFGAFQRLHRAEEFEGTGIGLAIAERVITRLGGRIWANGTVGAGATFWFSLPAAAL